MKYIVEKRVYKETEKIPLFAKVLASKELKKIENATSFAKLLEVTDITPMEGTDEPYYRLKFNNYRYMLYYEHNTEVLIILSLTHRKETYKKHKLPWRR